MPKKPGRWIPNQFYIDLPTIIAYDALMCFLLEFRVGGILEGMQLETVDYSHAAPPVGGMVVTFKRADGMHFGLDTTNVLTIWPEDRDDTAWQLETDEETMIATLRRTLAEMVTSSPLHHAQPLQPFTDNPSTKEPMQG